MEDHQDTANSAPSRRTFLKTAAVGVAAVAGASTLATPSTVRRASAAPAKDTTTLTVMYAANELTAGIKQFEELNPGISVRFITAADTTFKAMLAAGKPPDIYRSEGYSSVSLIVQGVFENLQPYLAKSAVLKESICSCPSTICTGGTASSRAKDPSTASSRIGQLTTHSGTTSSS